MKPSFSIFVAAALLLGSSSAEAAGRTASGSNPMLPPPSPTITSPPQTNPIGGGIGTGVTGQNFGALPGNPGSPTYNPNAALSLPSLNNSGSALPLAPQRQADRQGRPLAHDHLGLG